MSKTSPAPWILLVVGIVLMVGGTTWGVVRIVGEVSTLLPQETWVAGADKTVTLEAGDWAVYELSAQSVETGAASRPTVNPESIAVTGPGGDPIEVRCISCGAVSQRATVNETEYLGVVEFTAPTAGPYIIASAGEGNSLAIGKPVTEAFGSIFGGVFLAIGLATLGFVLFVAAIIWLIARSVNARKVAVPTGAAAPALPASGGAPRGWYPDSQNPGQLRWWDGTQWTENVKPDQ